MSQLINWDLNPDGLIVVMLYYLCARANGTVWCAACCVNLKGLRLSPLEQVGGGGGLAMSALWASACCDVEMGTRVGGSAFSGKSGVPWRPALGIGCPGMSGTPAVKTQF